MDNTLVTSLAILSVDDSNNRDFFDNFVPIVVEVINQAAVDIISVPEIKNEIKKQFKLDIPHHVLQTILRRRIEKAGYIRRDRGKYVRIMERLENHNFSKIQQIVLEQHEHLVAKLTNFANEMIKRLEQTDIDQWDEQISEGALQDYLSENLVQILKAGANHNQIPIDTHPKDVKSRYIVGSFIKHLQDTHSSSFKHLLDVVKGNMLANAIYYTDPGLIEKKFELTEIYFDSSFLIYALGYAGQHRQDPCSELFAMLRENGALLRCFRHTIDEMIGILESCKYHLNKGNYVDNHGTMEYFVTRKMNATDIELIIVNLEKYISRLGISIVDTPLYIEQYTIDEKEFRAVLETGMTYRDKAMDRDVRSISAIMNLRKHQKSYQLEASKALFVTTNYTLFYLVKNYFSEGPTDRTIPPVLHDSILTNLLWLKTPTKAPDDLPRKRIIADCMAAIQPSEQTWRFYLEKIDQMLEDKKISSEDYYLLRCSQEARTSLMEATLGDADVFAQGSVEEILSITKAKMVKEVKEEVKKKDIELEAAKREIEATNAEVAFSTQSRIEKYRNRAITYANRLIRFVFGLIGILFIIGQILLTFYSQLRLPLWGTVTVFVIFGVGIPFLGFVGYTFIKPLKSIRNRIIEDRIRKYQELFG